MIPWLQNNNKVAANIANYRNIILTMKNGMRERERGRE